MGEGDRAVAELQAALATAPAWLYGHEQLAQLIATQGRANEATSSLDAALARFPNAQPLWDTLLNVQLRRGAPLTPLISSLLAGVAAFSVANLEACVSRSHAFAITVFLWHGVPRRWSSRYWHTSAVVSLPGGRWRHD